MQPTQPSVLLVEDDINLARMYKIKFSKEGMDIKIAPDGEAALTVATQTPIDLILLDMVLPKMNGNQFLQKLRELPLGKNIPVIVLTNYSKKEDFEIAHSLGVVDYLSKAMTTPEQLVEKVRKYIVAH